MITTSPSFSSAMTNEREDYLNWKQEAESYKKKYRELQEEFEEFRQGSTELEKELESHIQILERNNHELKHTNAKLYNESQTHKRKLEQLNGKYKQDVSDLSSELTQTKTVKDSLQNYIRELEQSNDDLERAKRAAIVSLEDFESRLNHAIERNAFLESELDEKEQLCETVQRLKDKTKELKMELDVCTTHKYTHSTPTHSIIPHHSSQEIKPMQLMDIVESDQDSQPLESPLLNNTSSSSIKQLTQSNRKHRNNLRNLSKDSQDNNFLNGSPIPMNMSPAENGTRLLTPSSRINALNVVSDLIKKVGALENKLASCRNFTKLNQLDKRYNNNHHEANENTIYNGLDNSL